MIPLKSRPQALPSSAFEKRPRLRFSLRSLVGVGVLLALLIVAGAVIATQVQGDSHAAGRDRDYMIGRHDDRDRVTTINGLKKIAMVGSTANILDKNGRKIMVDPNPYGIAIAPANSRGLEKGDLLVTNIGNKDKGSTIVRFADQKGPGKLFNTMPGNGTLGPADLVFNHQTGSLWVANATGNFIQIYRPNGSVLATVKDPLFNGPWGIATNGRGTFFTANKLDAKILRIDIMQQGEGAPKFKVTQIAQFDKMPDATKIGLLWLPRLRVADRNLEDVLLALDPTNNRIAALPNSSKRTMNTDQKMGVTVFKGKPLNTPCGLTLNPLNGDLLVVNLADNNLVELNMTKHTIVGVKQIDPMAVDKQGNGSALFGVVATTDEQGNLRVFYTDDNTNSLNVLKVR
ncbi:MAG: hypothetical protein NVSMB44_45470 [Ktedonobacteraceae bacterium]